MVPPWPATVKLTELPAFAVWFAGLVAMVRPAGVLFIFFENCISAKRMAPVAFWSATSSTLAIWVLSRVSADKGMRTVLNQILGV